jgi:hypothetical protein
MAIARCASPSHCAAKLIIRVTAGSYCPVTDSFKKPTLLMKVDKTSTICVDIRIARMFDRRLEGMAASEHPRMSTGRLPDEQ